RGRGVGSRRVLKRGGEAVRAGPRIRGAGDGRSGERDGRAVAVRIAVGCGRRRGDRVDADVRAAGGRGAAADRDGHGVDARIGGRGVGTRRILQRGGEAVRAGPRIRGAGDGRRRKRDGRAFAVRAAVGGGRRGGRRVDHDVGRAGGRGAAAHRDGHGVDARIGGRGVGARRILERGGEAVRAGPRIGGAGDGRCGERSEGRRVGRAGG